MSRLKICESIRNSAIDLLRKHPAGLSYSELRRQIHEVNPEFNIRTVTTSIWNLVVAAPTLIYRPAKGFFRLCEFREIVPLDLFAAALSDAVTLVTEETIFKSFATWLTDDLEEVTHAIVLSGDTFNDHWGTPDVIGKFESRRSDFIKGPTSIVSASIRVNPNGLVTSFGQACAYKLFSHKSYLVIPNQTAADELIRMHSLCQIFGIGLVTFNSMSRTQPEFQLLVRATKHEPDLFYTNRYVAHVEKELFA